MENFVIWDEEIFAGVPLVVEYESPNDSAYQPFIGSTFDGTALTEGNFHFIGASVTFPAAASGTYQLIINGLDPITKNQTIYAAVRQNASASFSQTLTCGGFSPGVLDFTNISPDVESFLQLDAWMLELWQTTGNLIQVTDIRFWMITI